LNSFIGFKRLLKVLATAIKINYPDSNEESPPIIDFFQKAEKGMIFGF